MQAPKELATKNAVRKTPYVGITQIRL